MAQTVELDTIQATKSLQSLTAAMQALDKAATLVEGQMATLTNIYMKQLEQQNRRLTGEVNKLNTALGVAARTNARLLSSALLRQKKLAAQAEQQFKNLEQRLKLTGGTKVQIDSLSRSFQAFANRMRSGALTANQLADAQIRWARAQGTVRREMQRMNLTRRTAALEEFAKKGRLSSEVLRDLGSSAIFALGPLSGVGARVAAFGAVADRSGLKIAILAITMTGLVVSFVKFISAAVRADLSMQKIEATLFAVTGSAKQTTREMNFLRKVSLDLGLDIAASGREFAKLEASAQNTGIQLKDIRNLFKAGAEAATVLGLTTEETSRIFTAFGQIISKGTVQSEEIKQQLGDVLPGALQKTARAFGVTTSELLKMMAQGQALSSVFVKEFAKVLEEDFGKAVPAAIDRLDVEWRNLTTAVKIWLSEVAKATGATETLEYWLGAATRTFIRMSGEATSATTPLERLVEVNREIVETQRQINALDATKFYRTFRSAGADADSLRDKLKALAAEQRSLRMEIQEDRAGQPTGPSLKQLLGLPIEEIDKVRRKTESLNAQLVVLRDTSKDVGTRTKLADSIDDQNTAMNSAIRIIKKLTGEELFALAAQLRISATDTTAMRDAIAGLIMENKKLGDSVDETAERAIKMEEALQRFYESVGKSGVTPRVSKFAGDAEVGVANALLEKQNAQRKTLADSIKDLERANAVLHLRLTGEEDLTEQMESTFEIVKKFPDLKKDELEQVKNLLTENKKLTNELKAQEERNKAATEAAQDFAQVISKSFEDAVLSGESLRDVMQGLLDDINRIILRVLVTKPFENFLTKLLDPNASTSQGQSLFGGLLGTAVSTLLSGLGGGPSGGVGAGTIAASGAGVGGGLYGARQGGGHMQAGKMYRVHKDELVVPMGPSTVVPKDRASEGGVVVHQNYNITTPDANSFRASSRTTLRSGSRIARSVFRR